MLQFRYLNIQVVLETKHEMVILKEMFVKFIFSFSKKCFAKMLFQNSKFSTRSNKIFVLSWNSREREEIRERLMKEKHEYRKGFWNTQCINLGGLGKEPSIPIGQGVLSFNAVCSLILNAKKMTFVIRMLHKVAWRVATLSFWRSLTGPLKDQDSLKTYQGQFSCNSIDNSLTYQAKMVEPLACN